MFVHKHVNFKAKAIAAIITARTQTVKISMSVVCTTDAKRKINDNAHTLLGRSIIHYSNPVSGSDGVFGPPEGRDAGILTHGCVYAMDSQFMLIYLSPLNVYLYP